MLITNDVTERERDIFFAKNTKKELVQRATQSNRFKKTSSAKLF